MTMLTITDKNFISLVPGRSKTKRGKTRYLYSGVGRNPVIIDREKLMAIIHGVLSCTKSISLRFMILAGDTSKAKYKYLKDPAKCWEMIDFYTKEIIVEMGKFIKIMTTKRSGTTLQNRIDKNTVAINRHALATTTRRVLSNSQEILTLSLFLHEAMSKTSLFAYKNSPSKSWHLLDYLIDQINVEMGKLLVAMATKKMV